MRLSRFPVVVHLPSSLGHTTVLVVQRDPALAEETRQMLRRLGHEVVGVAHSAIAAVDAIERTRPGVILIDVQLNGHSDGIAAAEAIRVRFDSPIVFLTSQHDDSILAMAAETDAYGYLPEPFSERELDTAVKFATRRHEFEVKRKIARGAAQEELFRLSIRDELTDLYNRRGFRALAEQQLRIANRARTMPALLFIDLDGLKPINDTFGHEAGDRALADTAAVLTQTFRDSDIVGRLGGDEFVVLVPDGSEAAVARMRDRLRDNVEHFNRTNQRDYRLSLSVGASYYDATRPESLETLISQADQEMYTEKFGKKAPASGRVQRQLSRAPVMMAEGT